MAMRFEKSGGLHFVRSIPDPPQEEPKHICTTVSLWLALVVFVAGIVYASRLASGWPVLAHTIKGFLAAAR